MWIATILFELIVNILFTLIKKLQVQILSIFKLNSGDKRTQTVKRNVLWSFLIKGISILVSLLLVPLTLGYVSSEVYGIWLTLSSVLHWLTFMDVGFTLGLKNRLAEALAHEDYEKGKSLVSTTYFMMAVIFIPLSIFLILISPHINWCSFFNVNSKYEADVLLTIQLLSIFLALQMIVNVFIAVVAAYQKVALSSLFGVIGHVCALIVIFMMTKFIPPSLSNLTFAYSLMPILVVAIFSFIFFQGKFKKTCPSIQSINTKYIKDLWNLGVKFFIIHIQMIVLYQSTNILISNLDGPEAVTQYNIAYKVLNVVALIFTIILSPLWPAFTDAYAKKDYHWMNKTYHQMIKLFLLLSVLITFVVIISPILYQLWVGDKVQVPFILTVSIAIYTLIHCWDALQVMLINGIGTVQLQTYVTLIGLILHIPLALFLGQFIGIYGIIMSMCIINLIYCSFFTTQIQKILHKTAQGIWIK